MAPTADRFAGPPPPPDAQTPQPNPQKDNLEQALGAAAEAGAQEYEEEEVNPEYQGEISADDAGGTRMAQELNSEAQHRNREQALPKPPPDEASG